MTEALSSSLLLEQCVETGHLNLDDRMQKWVPSFSESATTVRDILSHRSQNGTFKYDAGRFAALTGVIEACVQSEPIPFRLEMTEKVFERLGMYDSVPAQSVGDGSAADHAIFTDSEMSRFSGVLNRLALPYRMSGGSASVNTSVSNSSNATTGAISTVLDMALYDNGLNAAFLLHRDTLSAMWSNARTISGASMPTGLGWFVQNYNGQAVYWQFGFTPGAASSLIVKVPGKNLTLILLANSDGLSAPFALQDGDVNASLFARAFLRLFIG